MHAYDCYQPHISSAGSAAGDTSCIPPAPTTNLAVIGNVTKDLSTCKKWGLRALGGTPPYNITLAAVGSPVVTNVTLPSGDDVLTWVDRALPNTQILGEFQMSLLKVFDLINICSCRHRCDWPMGEHHYPGQYSRLFRLLLYGSRVKSRKFEPDPFLLLPPTG